MRRPYLAGNWKMNLTFAESVRLAEDIRSAIGSVPDRDVALFPTFVSVAHVAKAMEGGPVMVGGQNCAATTDGAFTGEVSASILKSTGARNVILGHSERRHIYGETDEVVNTKMQHALGAGLAPILCVGETQSERESGQTLPVVERQIREGLKGLTKDQLAVTTIAYEPVWAIGTGLVATPEQAQDVHAHIRTLIRELDAPISEDMRILYGGSVKGSNVDGLMAQPDIDGALVGGASLKADDFARIVGFQQT